MRILAFGTINTLSLNIADIKWIKLLLELR
jgi:hypothetical protein